MKTSYIFLLFLFLISLLCLSAESFGQCEMKYTYTVRNTATGVESGEVAITFEKGTSIPHCMLFTYIDNTPTLLIDASKKTDIASNKVIFYGLAPGRYLVRANHKGCKAVIVGQDTEITVSTINVR
jgi:hypothetical protein